MNSLGVDLAAFELRGLARSGPTMAKSSRARNSIDDAGDQGSFRARPR